MNSTKAVASMELPDLDLTQVELSRKGFVTNYPPYKHWRKTVVPEILTEKPINIYFHSPYCIQRCAYCFYKTVTLRESQLAEIDRYIDAVCQEIRLSANRFHMKERPVDSIYFGGGTPTLLNKRNMARIIECLHENLNIDNPEFTVEAEPVTFTQKKADMLKEFGVNRINLGIQSFKDEIVELTGRKDTENQTLQAIDMAKNTGAVVNIDLISGLEGETPEKWSYSVGRAISVDVPSITVYKMELYPNTDYYAGVREQTLHLPSDTEEIAFMQHAIEKFEAANYLPWNWYTFTKMGQYEHVYPKSQWRGNDCLPFGVSAYGRVGDFLFQNTNDLEKYAATVEAGDLPINRGYRLNSRDQMIRDVILGIKLIHLPLTDFQRKYGFTLTSLCLPTLEHLQAEDFISFSDNEISLTSKGILYGDYVGKRLAQSLREIA